MSSALCTTKGLPWNGVLSLDTCTSQSMHEYKCIHQSNRIQGICDYLHVGYPVLGIVQLNFNHHKVYNISVF